MLTIKLFGDKQDDKVTWSIEAVDSRGTQAFTDGVDDSESAAKAAMLTRLGALIDNLVFKPIGEDGTRDNERAGKESPFS